MLTARNRNIKITCPVRIITHRHFRTHGLIGKRLIVILFAQMTQKYFLQIVMQQPAQQPAGGFIRQMPSVSQDPAFQIIRVFFPPAAY